MVQQDSDPDDGEQLLGRHGTGFGKPNLSLVNIEGKHLQDFVTPASWRFFRIMEISTEFLQLPAAQWCENAEYTAASSALRKLKVANEDAGRACKLFADFIGAKSENLYQNYLQIVETERQCSPDIRKSVIKRPRKK